MNDGSKIGVITGFVAEARLLLKGPWMVAMAGGRPDRASTLARTLAQVGVQGLLSFGIAGGLSRTLRPGTLMVADRVWSRLGAMDCDSDWANRLAMLLPGAERGVIAATDHVVARPDEKRALREQSGALAVDMESWGVAEAAKATGLPFAVIRAVADPAKRKLPPAALIGLDEDGEVRLGPVLLSVLSSPTQIPSLIRVGLDTKTALKALSEAVPALAACPPRM